MKHANAGIASDIQQGQTTQTHVLVLRRTDGVVICVTEHDQDLVFDATARAALHSRNFLHSIGHDVTALAYAGFSRFNLNDKDNLDTSNIQVDGMIDPEIFTRNDIKAERFDYADFQVFQVNWMDLTRGEIIGATGRTGTWTIKEFGFSTTFYGLAKQLDAVGGELIQPTCRVDFGSPRCAPGGILADGTTVDSLIQRGVVAATDGSRTLTAAAPAAGTGGVIATSALNAAGSGYAPGDTVAPAGGNGDAVLVIDTVDGGGGVLTFHLSADGTLYPTADGVPTYALTGAGNGFTVDITASAIVPATGITDNGRPRNGALLIWVTGNNAGLSKEAKIVDLGTGEITLKLPMFLPIQVGDIFRLGTSCDFTIGTCAGTHKNALNNQSEPYAPGLDWNQNYPDWHAPHP
jgi:hypothetical protein